MTLTKPALEEVSGYLALALCNFLVPSSTWMAQTSSRSRDDLKTTMDPLRHRAASDFYVLGLVSSLEPKCNHPNRPSGTNTRTVRRGLDLRQRALGSTVCRCRAPHTPLARLHIGLHPPRAGVLVRGKNAGRLRVCRLPLPGWWAPAINPLPATRFAFGAATCSLHRGRPCSWQAERLTLRAPI